MRTQRLGLAAAAAIFALAPAAKAQFGYFNSRPTIGYGNGLPTVGRTGYNSAAQGYRLSPLDLQAMRAGGYGAVGKGYNPIVTDPRTPHWLANPVVPAAQTMKAQATAVDANSGRVIPGRTVVPLNTPVWLVAPVANAPTSLSGLGIGYTGGNTATVPLIGSQLTTNGVNAWITGFKPVIQTSIAGSSTLPVNRWIGARGLLTTSTATTRSAVTTR